MSAAQTTTSPGVTKLDTLYRLGNTDGDHGYLHIGRDEQPFAA
jgi:hypothetical protein